jgi:asparagine synthetase B (glutamine-hydrolysing)
MLLFETDWLASDPVYYNEVTGAASHCVNDVIDFANVELDPEGLNAYLGTGFSLYQHTPVSGVRVLPPSSRLRRDAGGRLRVEEVPLDLDARLERRHTEDEVIDLLRARVQAAEAACDGPIVIPTSGGYDSRLLNLLVNEPARVRSFTFGPSARQWDSVEVTRARALSELLGTRWERIPIGAFHVRLDEWDDAFGPVTHAHGMYQMEFYDRIRQHVPGGNLVLSGLVGDWFQGKGDAWVPPVDQPADVRRLSFTFAMHVDLAQSRVPWRGTLCEEYFETHREILVSHRRRVIEAVRFRMQLLHYLLRVPRLAGLAPAAPFTDVDVATAMLTLPDERRHKRAWVTDYLGSRGALMDTVAGTSEYWLYWPVMRRQPLAPLDDRLLAEIVRPEYVRWINRTVSWRGMWYEGYERLGRRRGLRRAAEALNALGLRQRRLEAYHAYMTLRPLERLLRKRAAAQACSRGEVEPL